MWADSWTQLLLHICLLSHRQTLDYYNFTKLSRTGRPGPLTVLLNVLITVFLPMTASFRLYKECICSISGVLTGIVLNL